MAKKRLIKNGERTIIASQYGDIQEVKNRLPNQEAYFAMDLIKSYGMVTMLAKDGPVSPPGAVVERAFDIARLTFEHIKQNRMDTPFPFRKVYGDAPDA